MAIAAVRAMRTVSDDGGSAAASMPASLLELPSARLLTASLLWVVDVPALTRGTPHCYTCP